MHPFCYCLTHFMENDSYHQTYLCLIPFTTHGISYPYKAHLIMSTFGAPESIKPSHFAQMLYLPSRVENSSNICYASFIIFLCKNYLLVVILYNVLESSKKLHFLSIYKKCLTSLSLFSGLTHFPEGVPKTIPSSIITLPRSMVYFGSPLTGQPLKGVKRSLL